MGLLLKHELSRMGRGAIMMPVWRFQLCWIGNKLSLDANSPMVLYAPPNPESRFDLLPIH